MGFKGKQRFGAMVVGLIGEHGGVGLKKKEIKKKKGKEEEEDKKKKKIVGELVEEWV